MSIIDFTNVERVYHTGAVSPAVPVEIKKVYEGTTVVWEKPVDNKSIPLYIELVNPSDSIYLQIMASGSTTKTVYYSYDNQTWLGYSATNNPTTILLDSSNPRVYFEAFSNAQWSTSSSIYWYFRKWINSSTVPLRVGGNIYSLENRETSYQSVISPRGNYSFFRLFYGFAGLVDASQLYVGEGNSILSNYCFAQLFRDCASLTITPKLPATTLSQGCYVYMFAGCTSLIESPLLSAPILIDYCYSHMFDGCNSLNSIKCLATDILATGCTNDWLNNVSSTGTFTKSSSTTWSSGASGIPSGWTIVNV